MTCYSRLLYHIGILLHIASMYMYSMIKLAQNDINLQIINGIDRTRVNYFKQTAFMMAQERLGLSTSTVKNFESPAFSMAFMEELERLQENFDTIDNLNHKLLTAVVHETNSAIGYVDLKNLQYSKDGLPPGPYISDLVIHKSYRRQGIASSLLKQCYNICINDWDEYNVHLKCETSNLDALYLYLKQGFIPAFVEKTIYNIENDIELNIESFDSLHMKYYNQASNPSAMNKLEYHNTYDSKTINEMFLEDKFLKIIQSHERLVMKKKLLSLD